jgi:uncharacterized protein (UPF0335 family)
MANLFGDIKKALQGVSGQVKSLRAEIERLQRERETVAAAPAARQDVKDMVRAWVTRRGEEHLGRMRQVLGNGIINPKDLRPGGGFHPDITLSANSATRSADGPMCAFFGATVIDAMTRAIDLMEWPAPGPGLPLKERAQVIAKLDREIAGLVEQEREMLADARAAGVILE